MSIFFLIASLFLDITTFLLILFVIYLMSLSESPVYSWKTIHLYSFSLVFCSLRHMSVSINVFLGGQLRFPPWTICPGLRDDVHSLAAGQVPGQTLQAASHGAKSEFLTKLSLELSIVCVIKTVSWHLSASSYSLYRLATGSWNKDNSRSR